MTQPFLKTAPEDETIEVEATIAAPVARVWRAWTEPQELKQWFGRAPGSVLSAEADVRVGGRWCFRFQESDEGGRLEGEYLTVEPERRLVFTWRHVTGDSGEATPESRVTVTFADAGGKTAIAIRHEGVQRPEARRNIGGGWNDSIGNIEAFLNSEAAPEA